MRKNHRQVFEAVAEKNLKVAGEIMKSTVFSSWQSISTCLGFYLYRRNQPDELS
jgi:hypothetical protein